MKRELFKNIAVTVSPEGKAIDRQGFFSAVLAVSVGEITGEPDKCLLSVKLEHGDSADGTFTEVTDAMLDPERASEDGKIPDREVESGSSGEIQMDLLGCKQYIKMTPSISFEGGTSPTAAATYALVLGDPALSALQAG